MCVKNFPSLRASARRLHFQDVSTGPATLQLPTNNFYSRSSTTRFSDVFVPESPVRSECEDIPMWQPGQSLPTASQHDDLQAMLQSMQHTVETHLEEIKGKLTELDSRIFVVEKNQKELQETPSSSGESPDYHRKRKNPAELQVSKNFNVQGRM